MYVLVRGMKERKAHMRALIHCNNSRVKVKLYLYRPRGALRVPGGSYSQTSRQSAHEGYKAVSPTQRPPLPPRNITGTHSSSHFATKPVFTVSSCHHLAQNRSWRTTLCPLSAISYSTYSQLLPMLGAAPPSVTRRRAITW